MRIKSKMALYVFGHNPQRTKDDRVSMLIAAAYGSVCIIRGVPETTVAIQAALVVAILMTAFTLRYCVYSVKNIAPESGKEISRRVAWRTATAGVVSELSFSILRLSVGSLSAAVAYASKAKSEMIDNRSPSAVRTAIAKTVISTAIQNGVRSHELSNLRNAYTLLSASEVFSAARENSVIESVNSTTSKLENAIDNQPQTLIGAGPQRTTLRYAGKVPMFVVGRNVILRDMTIDASIRPNAEIRPSLFHFGGRPKVAVVNCVVKNFTVMLSNVSWVDVQFEDCSLFSDDNKVIIVDCHFEGCWVDNSLRISQPSLAALITRAPSDVTFDSESI